MAEYMSKREHIIEMGIKGFFDTYPFKHKQAIEILQILEKKYDLDKISLFIAKIRDICEGAACLLEQPDYKTYKNDRKSMMALLEKSKQLMDAICDDRAPIVRFITFQRLVSFNEEYETGSELASDCQEMAVQVALMIGILIRKLKQLDLRNEKAVKGRPTADGKGIVKEIAKAWEKCFEKRPTMYAGNDFEDILKIVLEGLKLKYEYPQRKIKDALKK